MNSSDSAKFSTFNSSFYKQATLRDKITSHDRITSHNEATSHDKAILHNTHASHQQTHETPLYKQMLESHHNPLANASHISQLNPHFCELTAMYWSCAILR